MQALERMVPYTSHVSSKTIKDFTDSHLICGLDGILFEEGLEVGGKLRIGTRLRCVVLCCGVRSWK